MMLAEDCKAWDMRSGAPPDSAAPMRPPSSASARLAGLSSSSACLPSHGSPTDSASSLHAECSLAAQESVCDEGGSSTFRCKGFLFLRLASCAAASAPILRSTLAMAS